ncbi:unannotated protein [freshwater metagenome]|uniref:Unannotated protein n=1 Tax=freshwater metagenome TaxID=449393 RepID=A0A6J7JW66_9ZZZZ
MDEPGQAPGLGQFAHGPGELHRPAVEDSDVEVGEVVGVEGGAPLVDQVLHHIADGAGSALLDGNGDDPRAGGVIPVGRVPRELEC